MDAGNGHEGCELASIRTGLPATLQNLPFMRRLCCQLLYHGLQSPPDSGVNVVAVCRVLIADLKGDVTIFRALTNTHFAKPDLFFRLQSVWARDGNCFS